MQLLENYYGIIEHWCVIINDIEFIIPFLGVPKWATKGIRKGEIIKQEQSKENDVTCDRPFDNP